MAAKLLATPCKCIAELRKPNNANQRHNPVTRDLNQIGNVANQGRTDRFEEIA
jgi:hypothetical protein